MHGVSDVVLSTEVTVALLEVLLLLLLLLQMIRLKWCCRENPAGALYKIIRREKLVNISQNYGRMEMRCQKRIYLQAVVEICSRPANNLRIWISADFCILSQTCTLLTSTIPKRGSMLSSMTWLHPIFQSAICCRRPAFEMPQVVSGWT